MRSAPFLIAAAIAAGALAAAPETPSSAHWKTTVTMEGARPGDKLQEAEVWRDGGRMRIEDRTPGVPPTNLVSDGGEVYVWEAGKTAGIRMAQGMARQRGRPLHEYVRRVADIRSKGTLLREEKLDGHVCDVYAWETPQDGKGTYWLARDLKGFPLRVVIERPQLSPYRSKPIATITLDYRNRDVRVPASVPDGLLEPPDDVKFQDASEILGGHPKAGPL
jgi:hypothetical protein